MNTPMSSQQQVILAATDFLQNHIFTAEGHLPITLFQVALNKLAADELDELTSQPTAKNEKLERAENLFWKTIRWNVSQSTMESFTQFFNQSTDPVTFTALKSAAALTFATPVSFYEHLAETESFKKCKKESLRRTEKTLSTLIHDFEQRRGSGQSITTTAQTDHDRQVGALNEIIKQEGRPMLTPLDFLKCYSEVLTMVTARAREIAQWSVPAPTAKITKTVKSRVSNTKP